MFYTARQLESLLKETGAIVLPYRARLTPAAKDFVREKKIAVGYADVAGSMGREGSKNPVSPYLWWCDGPCGIAKAALSNVALDTPLAPMVILSDSTRVKSAVDHLAREVTEKRAAGGILVAPHAVVATVIANRSKALRAIVGTSLAAVEAGIEQVAANVLILETDRQAIGEMRQLIRRFVTAKRTNEFVETA